MSPLTPAELDRAEREINRNLAAVDAAQGAPRRAVCMHPDRSVMPGVTGTGMQCDYCDAFAVAPYGVPDIMPTLYLLDD